MHVSSSYTPVDALELFKDWGHPWWVAGGWALDLFLGTQTREHEDLDIAILRKDQSHMRNFLQYWDMRVGLGDGKMSEYMWDGSTYIEAPVPALWCKEQGNTTWAFELLLTDTHEGDWVSRRDTRVTLPLSSIGALSPTGIPYLAPEIVLAYKAKDRGLEKDREDFFRVLPHLTVTQRAWLAHTLHITNPDHPWLNALKLQ